MADAPAPSLYRTTEIKINNRLVDVTYRVYTSTVEIKSVKSGPLEEIKRLVREAEHDAMFAMQEILKEDT